MNRHLTSGYLTSLLIAACILILSAGIHGAKAYPRPRKVMQPDGTSLTIVGHGDEFSSYITTTDGYTVMKCDDGFYRYAGLSDGGIVTTSLRACDPETRSQADADYLFSIPKGLKPGISATAKSLRKGSAASGGLLIANRAQGQGLRKKPEQSGQFRGLVIMVNFNDRRFTRGELARQLADDRMNKTGYTGYSDGINGTRVCTGSVKDYFIDNSYGMFSPDFDVVGPVDIDASQYYINKIERTYEIAEKVLKAADDSIDYSRYDCDGDGVVDMFYILYAGYSSNYSGNDTRLVWPHAGDMADEDIDLTLDGKKFGRFACSSEIFGWEEDGDTYLDGIGVIVHEFSHVLGFKDHYDVSECKNEDPGTWDVMASGNYGGDFNDTPCGYSAYEKYAAGFMKPRNATRDNAGESVELRSILTSDDAVRIQSMQDSVIFLVENRQPRKWDESLPGHGMLVWRVDSCDAHYWAHNAVNVEGKWHVRLVKAKGAQRSLWGDIEDGDTDPFPGSGGVVRLTNFTEESNMLTHSGIPSPVVISDIDESGDGLVSFTLEADPEADTQPYIFRIRDGYAAKGTLVDDSNDMEWTVATEIIEQPGMTTDRHVIYNLAPDVRNISATDPKYAKGLGATCLYADERQTMIIEPTRVATTDTEGIWLVDLSDLEKGGSGAIVFNMNGYGMLDLADPEALVGYVTMNKSVLVPSFEKVIERFGVVSGLVLDGHLSVETPKVDGPKGRQCVYNMQGMRVSNPRKGEMYIINGRKVIL